MADVFISYSRKDQAFVRRLHNALSRLNRDTWVDWEDIPLTADWLKEIYAGIESADTFVFVISPDSVASGTCKKEIAHAAKHNKRIIPMVLRDVPDDDMPEVLRPINWIFFRSSDDFDAKFQEFVEAIDTDLDWVKTHTKLLTKTVDWNTKKKADDNTNVSRSRGLLGIEEWLDDGLLLRGRELRSAEVWLKRAVETGRKPLPTFDQIQYIHASRKTAQIRVRVMATFIVLFFVTVGIAILFQNGMTNAQVIAKEREKSALAETQSSIDQDPHKTLLTAIGSILSSPTAKAESDLRQALLASRVRKIIQAHNGSVTNASFSPDGKYILTLGRDGVARVWEVNTGSSVAELRGRTSQVNSVIYSPEGKTILTANNDGTASIWDIGNWTVITELMGHTGPVRRATFSPDGEKIITASDDATVRVWDSEGNPLGVISDHYSGTITTLEFSSDGKLLVAASSNGIGYLWDISSGKSPLILDNITDAVFCPNSKSIVAHSRSGPASVWDAITGQRSLELRLVTNSSEEERVSVTSLACNPNSRSAAIGYDDGSVRVWDIGNGQVVKELIGHTFWVSSIAFSPDGQWVLAASRDKTARIWETTTGRRIAEFRGHTGLLNTANFSPDGKLIVTASDDGTVRVWQAVIDRVVAELRGHTDAVWWVDFSPDEKFVAAASKDKTASIWELSSGRRIELRGHKGEVVLSRFSPDGQLIVTGSHDTSAMVWDVNTGKLVSVLNGNGSNWSVGDARFSPDSKWVVTATNPARVWEARTGKLVTELSASVKPSTVAFSPDGQFVVTADSDGIARVWEASTGKLLKQLQVYNQHRILYAATFSPDGEFVTTVSYGTASRSNWRTGIEVAVTEYRPNVSTVLDIALSRDGQWVAIPNTNLMQLWDMSTGRNLVDIPGYVWKATFSNDSKLLATADLGSKAHVWETSTGLALIELPAKTNLVDYVAISPDNKYVVTAGQEGGVLIHFCEVCGSIEDLLTLARERVSRELSCQERQIYFHENITCPNNR